MVVPVFSSNTRVYFNTMDLSSVMNDAALEAAIDTADVTSFGDTARVFVPGPLTRTFTGAGHYEGTSQLVLHTALTAGSGILTFCPGGAATQGDLAWLSSVVETTLSASSPIADIVAFAWDAQTAGVTGFGWVQHPLAEDTNTTTGGTFDGTASTSTGWHAHLHVTLVDGGSWVIKLQDASASNFSDVADVTGGAFTAATTPTQQRLVSAAGATLRRYVRCVATRTGGAGGDGITYHLSVSRSAAA